MKLSKTCKAIDERRKELKKEAEKAAREIHEYGKSIHDRVAVLRDGIKAQVDAYDEEQARIEAERVRREQDIEARIQEIRSLCMITGHETAEELDSRLDACEGLEINQELFGAREQEARELLDGSIGSLKMFFENVLQAEKEKAELEALRKEKEERERKEQAEKEAEARRQREEEIAEQARQAERERLENEQRRREEAKAQQVEESGEDVAVSPPDGSVNQPATGARPQNITLERRRQVNRKIKQALLDRGITNEVTAEGLVRSMALGEIPHVQIVYSGDI